MLSYLSSFNLIYFFTFTILLTSPLPYGSVTPGGKLILQGQAFLLLFIYLIHIYTNNKPFPDFKDKYQPLGLLAFLLLCIFQIIPLPGSVLGLISSTTYEIWIASQRIITEIGFKPQRYFYTNQCRSS